MFSYSAIHKRFVKQHKCLFSEMCFDQERVYSLPKQMKPNIRGLCVQ